MFSDGDKTKIMVTKIQLAQIHQKAQALSRGKCFKANTVITTSPWQWGAQPTFNYSNISLKSLFSICGLMPNVWHANPYTSSSEW